MRTRVMAALVVVGIAAFGLTGCIPPDRTYTYRIATRGPIVADVGHFAAHVQATLDDPRGWSLGGAIHFTRTNGPADFTIWLAAAGSLPSFGSPCSSQWSCRAGPNVIINQDRWLGATPTWPYGLDAYQHYVVNHEVGHWMGFAHATCPGPGQRAPVMVQQSKGGAAMGSCAFNIWPTGGELTAAASRHRVGLRPTGLPTPNDPFGVVHDVVVTKDEQGTPTSVRVVGWTIDGDTTAPLRVVVVLNGAVVADTVAGVDRPDLAHAYPFSGTRHGFDISVPATSGKVCVVAVGSGPGAGLHELGCGLVK